MAAKTAQKAKKGNKHATNTRRRERKAKTTRVSPPGNCGSSFCSKQTGCDPWK